MIKAENIHCRRGKKDILTALSCSVPAAQVTMLLGPNGAGKTTLLDILAGYRSPDSGVVTYNKSNIAKSTRLSLAKKRAVVSQKSELQFPFSVRDVVLFGRHPYNNGMPNKHDEEIVRQSLAELAAEHLLERNYLQLSGGEQQMVQVARALAQLWRRTDDYSNTCLCLDEATANLDLQHQATVCDVIARFTQKGAAVLMIAHDLNMALRYGQHFILVKAGRIAAEGGAAEIQEQALLEDVFDCRLQISETGAHCVVFPESMHSAVSW